MLRKKEMQSKKKSTTASTVKHLPFSEIKEDVVIMKDASLRAVLDVSSLNFALKGEDEQNAIINGYVQMLNSLDFPIQVVIQSRKLDITNYLSMLSAKAKVQTNELLKVQILEYKQYVKELVSVADIMQKKFYIVVPYSAVNTKGKQKNYWQRVNEVIFPGSTIRISKAKFQKYKIDIDRRTSQVASGLTSIGLEVKQLDTRGLIDLYYQAYNPKRTKSLPKLEIDKMRIEEEVK